MKNLDRRTKKMERGFQTFSLFYGVYNSPSRCNLKIFSKYISFFKIKKNQREQYFQTTYLTANYASSCAVSCGPSVTPHCSGPTHYSIIRGQPINNSSISSAHLQNSALIPSSFPRALCGVLFHFSLIFVRLEPLSQKESVVFQITFIYRNNKTVTFKRVCRKL